MIADLACFERGCACHDDRESAGVRVIQAQVAQTLLHELDKLFLRNPSITKDQIAQQMFNLRVELNLSK